MAAAFVLCLLLAGFAAGSAAPVAAPHDFNLQGVHFGDFFGDDGARAMVVQQDGKIVLAGYTSNGSNRYDFALERLNPDYPDWSLDSSFGPRVKAGVGGKTTVDFGDDDFATAVALQPDGKIVVAGYTASGSHPDDFALARLNPNGSPDSSFGTGGKATVDFGREEDAYAVALQPDGKILVAGNTPNASGDEDFAVARLSGNGTLDPSFGAGGRATVDFGGEETAYAVALQPDGKILVAGNSSKGSEVFFAVARLNANGTLDPSFGTGGKVAQDFASTDGARAMVVQPDGKILVAGNAYGSTDQDLAVWRLTPNGAPDLSFGPLGLVLVEAFGDDHAYAVALQPDGKIVVAGSSSDASTSSALVVARLKPNGSPDPSFFGVGRIGFEFGSNSGGIYAYAYGHAAALLASGDVAVAGYASDGGTNSDFVVVPLPGFRRSPQIRSAEVFGHGKLRRLLVDLHASERASARLRLLAWGVARLTRTFSVKPGQNVLQTPIPLTFQPNNYQLEITLVDARGHRRVYRSAVFVPG